MKVLFSFAQNEPKLDERMIHEDINQKKIEFKPMVPVIYNGDFSEGNLGWKTPKFS